MQQAQRLLDGGMAMLNVDMMGEKLRKLREESGFKQSQIAEYLNVDQSYISRFEKNERSLSTDLIEKLSNLFGCSKKFFLTGNDRLKPLPFALRASNITTDDLVTIAAINKIALNLRNMESLIKGKGKEEE